MSTRSIVNRAKLEAWASHFAEQKSSGLTVADWCQRNGISRHSYFYWKRKLKDGAVSQALPEIVPLAVPPVLVSVCNSQVLTPVHDQSCKCCTSCASCTTIRYSMHPFNITNIGNLKILCTSIRDRSFKIITRLNRDRNIFTHYSIIRPKKTFNLVYLTRCLMKYQIFDWKTR